MKTQTEEAQTYKHNLPTTTAEEEPEDNTNTAAVEAIGGEDKNEGRAAHQAHHHTANGDADVTATQQKRRSRGSRS